MKLLDLTLPTPAENLALDEALLDAAEVDELPDEVLRLWEPAQPMVVVGRSSRVAEEVNMKACRAANVLVFRRSSGGAAIVTGPGCLMFSVVLRYEGRQHLRMIDQAHEHVLGIVASAIAKLVPGVERRGTSDLAIGGRKFSGNSLRCKREHLLYHGTLLYDFDLSLIERLLRMPPRMPEYRGGREHGEFVMNLDLNGAALKSAIAEAFDVTEPLTAWPDDATRNLAEQRYSQDSWNLAR
jgi:lipoate-protein ligase A